MVKLKGSGTDTKCQGSRAQGKGERQTGKPSIRVLWSQAFKMPQRGWGEWLAVLKEPCRTAKQATALTVGAGPDLEPSGAFLCCPAKQGCKF